jgi:peptidoglycan/LPS O-acetylase OafA/YrhL
MRNYSIDVLRGLCGMSIVLHHAFGQFFPGTFVNVVIRYSLVFSVYVFFLISGYAITQSLSVYRPSLRNCLAYVLRRMIRLDIPYWTMIGCYFVLQTGIGSIDYDYLDLLANLFYVQRVFGLTQVIGVAWTLCLEVQFYLLMLGLYSCVKSDARVSAVRWFCVGFVMVGFLPWSIMSKENWVFEFAPWFVSGILVAPDSKVPLRYLVPLICGMFSIFAVIRGYDGLDASCVIVYGSLAAWFVFTDSKSRSKAIVLSALHEIGKYTYSLYLVHMMAIKLVSTGLSSFPSGLKLVISLLVTLVLTFVLQLSVERFALKLSRKVTYS